MADDVAKLLVQVSATTELLRQNLTKAERAVADFERDTSRRLQKVDGNFSKLGGGLGKVKSALGGFTTGAITGLLASLSVGTITTAIKNSLDFAGGLGEVAQQLGVTTKFLQEFRFAAGQNGATMEQADASLGKFTLTLGKALNGAKAQAGAFSSLGVSIRDANGNIRDSDAIFNDVADAIARIPDPARQAAAAMQIFGKGYGPILPLLKQGAAGFRASAEEARQFGIILSDKQIQDADKTADKISALQDALKIKVAAVVAENAGAIGELANGLADLAGKAVRATAEFIKFVNGQSTGAKILRGISENLPGANAPKLIGATYDYLSGSPAKAPPPAKKPAQTKPKGLPGLTPVSFFTAQANPFAEFRAILADLRPEFDALSEKGQELSDSLEADLATMREQARIAKLRADGMAYEADLAEALNSLRGQYSELMMADSATAAKALGISQTEVDLLRQKVALMEQLTVARVDAEAEQQALDAELRAAKVAFDAKREWNDELNAQQEAAQMHLAGLFETALSGGFDDVWKQFKAQGIQALSYLLASMITGQGAGGLFGGGGGGGVGGFLGGLMNVFGLFNGGGIGGGIQFRASGGPVKAGHPYIVGEKRAELFVPRVDGNIIPRVPAMGGGGGLSVTINAPGATAETVARIRAEIRAAAPAIVAASQGATMRSMNRARLA